MDEDYVSDSSSDFDECWIDTFLAKKGNDFFCEIDEEYIRDKFNLTGLNQELNRISYLVDIITDVVCIDLELEKGQEELKRNTAILYGLIHARYILTPRGLNKMFEKYKNREFGLCPRVYCQLHPLLPIGLHDQLRYSSVKLYCAKCEEIYIPKSSKYSTIDGVYFGLSFPPMFFQHFAHATPLHSSEIYQPKIFGFKLLEHSKLNRWREYERRKMVKRLKKKGIEMDNVIGGFSV